jgi:hypothetical protein
VDDSGLTRFVPRAEADGWSAAIAATAGPGQRSTGFCIASQHAQGMTLFDRFFSTPTHPHDGILPNYFNKPVDLPF